MLTLIARSPLRRVWGWIHSARVLQPVCGAAQREWRPMVHVIHPARWMNGAQLLRRACFTALVSVALAACSPAPVSFKNTDITGSALTADFELQDVNGSTVRKSDFKGQLLVLFFGFTQCPDVCPTTLQNMAEVMKRLGPDAGRVRVVFVTLDPARDTPELLKAYVPQFHPTFSALTGTDAQIAAAAKGLRIFYQKVDGKTATSYTFDHTASAYVVDTQGTLRLLVRHAATPDDIATDLKQLLR